MNRAVLAPLVLALATSCGLFRAGAPCDVDDDCPDDDVCERGLCAAPCGDDDDCGDEALVCVSGRCLFVPGGPRVDGGASDAGVVVDGGAIDGGAVDGGEADGGVFDAGDGGAIDAGLADAGSDDAGACVFVPVAAPRPTPTDGGACNDGRRQDGEECDDARFNDGGVDGCSNDCRIDPGYACFDFPSFCVPEDHAAVTLGVDGGAATIAAALAAFPDAGVVLRLPAGVHEECVDVVRRDVVLWAAAGDDAALHCADDEALAVGPGSVVQVYGVQLSSCGGGALRATGDGTVLFVARSVLGPSTGRGLDARVGFLAFAESIVHGARATAIRVDAHDGVAFLQNVIVRGAVATGPVVDVRGSAFVAHMTVTGSAGAVGVACELNDAGTFPELAASVVAGNDVDAGVVGCILDDTLVTADADALVGPDGRAVPASACSAVADEVAPYDIDYEPRVAPGDCGADEIAP